jgi:hypothetical protein
MADLPARRIGRDALERIIQRAAELQAAELETGEELTEAELLKLGADVGIDGRFLRQALYEEAAGAGAPLERGWQAKWFGPGVVRASRVIQGGQEEVEAAIEQWMAKGELLSVKRRLPDRTTWERQKGFFAEMKRGFGVGGRTYELARARETTTALTPLEQGYCHVELAADISNRRGAVAGGAFAIGSTGAAGVALASVLAAPVVVPVFIGVAFGAGTLAMTRAHRPAVERTQIALEQILDRLERGEIKPKHRLEDRAGVEDLGAALFRRVAGEVRKAVGEGMDPSRRRLPRSY